MGPKHAGGHGRGGGHGGGDRDIGHGAAGGGGGRGRGGGRGGGAGGRRVGRKGGGTGHKKARAMEEGGGAFGNGRKKSLLIGINYTGTQSALHGCQEDVENVAQFLHKKGYPSDKKSQIIMTDASPKNSPLYPTGANILKAMDWLVKEPGTCNFLHYSGHGGQMKDETGQRDSGYDDTIVPVDYETKGQINSDTLHRHLISAMPPKSTLFVIFDCCHSGSAIELPYVYRTDDDGNVDMMDNLKVAGKLFASAAGLVSGGLSLSSLSKARDLASGAGDLFKGFGGGGNDGPEGLDAHDDFGQDWSKVDGVRFATMFSGCQDDQTSADASIGGESQGAMSWAFLSTVEENPNISYIDALVETRKKLKKSKYTQIPQLSVGYEDLELDQPLRF